MRLECQRNILVLSLCLPNLLRNYKHIVQVLLRWSPDATIAGRMAHLQKLNINEIHSLGTSCSQGYTLRINVNSNTKKAI